MSFEKEKKVDEDKTLVVGLGASAGGLEPLKKFFNSLPEETGMAFIVVLHLSPDRESKLAEILQRETSLEVRQIEKRTSIKSNHIYVIPPNKLLSVQNNHLELSEPVQSQGPSSIDLLFRTLGRKKKKYAAGVILSGTGSDGAIGMKVIKEEGGITIAQNPDEAAHSGMPVNAIQTGAVDKVVSVTDIGKELIEYRESLSLILIPESAGELSEEKTDKILRNIFNKIRSKSDHDFSNYRRSSVIRRIDRRMRINRIKSLSEYLMYLDEYPDEVDELQKDLLISVTNFFRDPEAFKALENKAIPKLFGNKSRNKQVRVWIPGCATGEEAYSIAILLQEYAMKLEDRPEIQIFATDIDMDALEVARSGRYPKSISNDVSPKRLKRFFKENGDEYLVERELREIVLFASHDLLRNPPFSRLDLISCRNLLIYLNKELQTEVFNLFHYSLRDSGLLFLGKSDSRTGTEELFNPVDKEFRIYRREANVHSRLLLPDMPLLYKAGTVKKYSPDSFHPKDQLEKIHWSILARLYAPQSVLISKNHKVIHSTEGINKYLEYSGGEPSSDILNMVKPEIRQGLRSMLFQLKNEEPVSVQKRMNLNIDGQAKKLDLIVRRFIEKEFPEGLIQIVFKEISSEPEKSGSKSKKRSEESAGDENEIIQSLENELEYTREQLQLTVEEYETSNEELRASNEELQSINEELQSATEELETSKEELQSLNEELKTVNDQLESKVKELSRAHSDLENLMEATEVGIIFVDRDLRIQRFTSTSTEIFNLIPSDEGRPLQHITHSLKYENLIDDIKRILGNLGKIKKVVSTKTGRWYIMRLRPYRSSEDQINGAVLSFTEFTELKEARDTIKEQTLQETLAILGVYALEQDDLEMIMHRAIQQSCAIMNLECAMILTLSDDEKTFKIASESGCGCEDPDIEIENDERLDIGYSLTSKNPVNVLDYSEEKRFRISPVLEEGEFTSSAHIAIRGTENVYGVFAVYSKEKREFSDQDLHFIQVVANILGRSIEQKIFKEELLEKNKQLIQEMKRTKRVKREIIENNVLQRWELGGYLHDNFGQLLASAKILVDDIKFKVSNNDDDIGTEADQINQILNQCITSIRDIIHDIIPVDVEREGVAQAFRMVMNHTSKMYNVRCFLENDDFLNEIKNRKTATHLYYIVQEAFKNAATHGKAGLIVISARKKNGKFQVQIKDNGIGLEKSKKGNGKGIRIMKHRMDLLGGSLKIEDYSEETQSGTVVICTLPIEKLKRDD